MVTKLLRHVPLGGRPYCEPYMGAASLFFARPPAPIEVLNDVDGELVNLFRCLQNPQTFAELRHRLLYTLYARAEFCRALEILKDHPVTDPVMRAWAFFVSRNLGVATTIRTAGNWSRTFTSRSGIADTTNRWIMRLTRLADWHRRLLVAQIDNRDALDVIRYWDTPDAVFYVDPPYHPATRRTKSTYAVEPSHGHHEALVATLLACRGAVVLSCYDHPVYVPLVAAGWQKTEYAVACHAAVHTRNFGLQGPGAARRQAPRTEVVLSNMRAVEMLKQSSREHHAQ
jgi:DNA adenine methylase